MSDATIIPLDNVDPAMVEELLDRAFEPERKQRTAYKVREGMDWLPALSDGEGRAHPMIMVGPVAVLPEEQMRGFGKALMAASLGSISDAAPLPQVMIGDADYYGRFWGFSSEPTQGWTLPGPYDPVRLLVRCENPAILPREGTLGPWRG